MTTKSVQYSTYSGEGNIERKLAVFTPGDLLDVFAFFSKIVKRGLVVERVLVCGCALIYDHKCLGILSRQEEKGIPAPNSQAFHRLCTGVRLAHAALFSRHPHLLQSPVLSMQCRAAVWRVSIRFCQVPFRKAIFINHNSTI